LKHPYFTLLEDSGPGGIILISLFWKIPGPVGLEWYLQTEKCQFRTEKCQFRTEKCQFRTEKCQFSGHLVCGGDPLKRHLLPTANKCTVHILLLYGDTVHLFEFTFRTPTRPPPCTVRHGHTLCIVHRGEHTHALRLSSYRAGKHLGVRSAESRTHMYTCTVCTRILQGGCVCVLRNAVRYTAHTRSMGITHRRY
jgi:hypothetical protein